MSIEMYMTALWVKKDAHSLTLTLTQLLYNGLKRNLGKNVYVYIHTQTHLHTDEYRDVYDSAG